MEVVGQLAEKLIKEIKESATFYTEQIALVTI